MTKDEIYKAIQAFKNGMEQELTAGLAVIGGMVAALPDDGTVEPVDEIVREINLIGWAKDGKPEILVEGPGTSPGRPYFPVTRLVHDGPDTNIAVSVVDRDKKPINGIPVRFSIEGTGFVFIQKTGDKSPGLCEQFYDENLWDVQIFLDGCWTDVVRHLSTSRDIPENPLNMTDKHVRTSVEFTRIA